MIFPASRGIASIPHIDALIGGKLCQKTKDAQRVAGWGMGKSGQHAISLGLKYNLRPLFLEDGFLRSFGDDNSCPPLSIVVDGRGIYYNSTQPSSIEDLLNSGNDILADIYNDVIRARDLILYHKLSKYNLAPLFNPDQLRSTDKKRILLVDQTEGDLSITLGGASSESFQAMLEAARAEHPDATVYIKTSSSPARGHFAQLREDERTILLHQAVNPLGLLQHMDHVYVVSSSMGFEALLAGKPVTCFGMPWYAGWGVTDDRLTCPRRTRHRSVLELFAAGYFHYARYLNPCTLQQGTIFDVIEWLVRQREKSKFLHGEDGQGRLICIGYRRWKQANLSPILSIAKDQLHFVVNARAAGKLLPKAQDKLICWGAEPPEGVQELARTTGATIMRMEDGFIRSIGLGSDFIPPFSIVLDSNGIYFDPRTESDLEKHLSSLHLSEEERTLAKRIRQQIVDQGVTKYNMEPRNRAEWPYEGRRVLLVPGQVEDDASIRLGCSAIRSNAALLKATREAHPDAFIVYKPHPDVLSGNRRGVLALEEARKWADHIETALSIISCIEACDEVHTMTSLSGFDALIRGKHVVTHGQPFYAGWGLTEDRASDKNALIRRTRNLDMEELVAGTLLHYPLYWDPELKGFTTCEAVIRRIVEKRSILEQAKKLGSFQHGSLPRLLRKARILSNAWLSTRF